MLELLTDPNAWAALVTLTVLEIVLGIDNVVFISILVARLPEADSRRARQIGLSLALVFRIVLLFALTTPDAADLSGLHRVRQRAVVARHHPDRRRAFS